MNKMLAAPALALAALGMTVTSASAAVRPPAHPPVVTVRQTCLPAVDFGGSVPAGDDRCYVNAEAVSGPVVISVTSTTRKVITVSYQYCVNWPPNARVASQSVMLRTPGSIKIYDPFCARNYGFPRGLVGAEMNVPASQVGRTQLTITS